MRTLVGFSGGIESTALLKYLLTATNDEICAFHIYCPNSRSRAHLEWNAVQSLLPELQKIRPFIFNRIDIHFPFDLTDPDVQCTVLPALMREYRCDRFLRGLNAEDLYPSGLHENRDRLVKWVNFWLKTDADLSPDLPMFYWPKSQHLAYISEYLHLTFSCLSPVDDVPCGKCRTCLLINHASV